MRKRVWVVFCGRRRSRRKDGKLFGSLVWSRIKEVRCAGEAAAAASGVGYLNDGARV